MKQGTGADYLMVGWSGPVSNKTVVIDAPYLQPWAETPRQEKTVSPAEVKRAARKAREAALAPAQAAVAEQRRTNGAAYRYADAARALKANTAAGATPESKELVEAAVLRYETLAKLRTFVQAELAKAPVRGVWVAFGGQADVTGASDEGVTVAPGRIVEWAKIPPDQMLRLVNATVPKAVADPTTRGTLLLAAAVFCKEVGGGLDLALKYRERAIAMNATLVPVADRMLGGSPEAITAQPRIEASRAELGKAAAAVAGLAQKGLTTKTHPTSVERVIDFATPVDRGDKYIARLRGYLIPSDTDNYTFYITADDQGEFWLSTDESPDHQTLCVKVDVPSKKGQWDKDKRKSKPVSLVKGRRYSVKGLLREGEKGDHFAVAWSLTAKDSPALITSDNLVCEAAEGLPPSAQELRKKIEGDLTGLKALAAELTQLREADEALQDAGGAATAELANVLQKQAARAKEALREAGEMAKRVEAALPQLKAACRPESAKS